MKRNMANANNNSLIRLKARSQIFNEYQWFF